MRTGSILISFAAITLLATAFGAHFYSGSLSSVLLTLSLIALCIAIALHVRFLLLARREHRETASALDATEREYKSVFDSTLDAILILDDRGICLEANPAALTLFGTDRDEVVGKQIEKFFPGAGNFKQGWNRFSRATTNVAKRRSHEETARSSSLNIRRRRTICLAGTWPYSATSPAGSRRKKPCVKVKNDFSRWPAISRKFSGCWTLRI
jgi:PAS domain-containing protein